MYVIVDQKYLNIVKSEIITVKNIDKKKRSKPTLNTLASKRFFKIFIHDNINNN